MTSDGRWIVSGSRDRSVIFWNAETGEPYLVMKGHENSVVQLASGHSSRIFATGSEDKTVRVWSYSE